MDAYGHAVCENTFINKFGAHKRGAQHGLGNHPALIRLVILRRVVLHRRIDEAAQRACDVTKEVVRHVFEAVVDAQPKGIAIVSIQVPSLFNIAMKVPATECVK